MNWKFNVETKLWSFILGLARAAWVREGVIGDTSQRRVSIKISFLTLMNC